MDSGATTGLIEGFGRGRPDGLVFTSASAALAPWVTGFAHRQDSRCGHVVFELPELRPTVQIMFADDYWLRERDDPMSWRVVPRLSLWGPRVTWGYGYARQTVHAFGFALTPRGFAEIFRVPAGEVIDQVFDLHDIRPDFARAVAAIVRQGAPDDWTQKLSDAIMRLLGPQPSGTMLDQALSHLVEGEPAAVRQASDASGLGERQFRRRFRVAYGLSPRLYRRVLRIDRLMRRLHPAPWEKDEHDGDLNFADQAHMIREFKALTGVTPGEYVRSKRTHGDATIRSVIAHGIAPPML